MSTSVKPAPAPTKLVKDIQSVPYITGFCGLGAHEGTTVLDAKGSLMRPCLGEYNFSRREGGPVSCKCSCHDIFREIRRRIAAQKAEEDEAIVQAIIDSPSMPRPATTETEVLESMSGFHGLMPVQEMVGSTDTRDTQGAPVSVAASGPITPPQPGAGASALMPFAVLPLGSPAPRPSGPALQASRPDAARTKSGRLARGSLEDQVIHYIKQLGEIGGIERNSCTPKMIAQMIGDPIPSSGAVYAVFKRLEKTGRVTLAEKPFRVTESRL